LRDGSYEGVGVSFRWNDRHFPLLQKDATSVGQGG
jgi:hypothetical protein